jgi:hypothetical protein
MPGLADRSGRIRALNKTSLALMWVLGVASSAYAQTSARVTPGVATQPAVPPSAGPATTATDPTIFKPESQPGRPADDIIKQARRSGYVMKSKSGHYFFCKEEAATGTRLTIERCVTSNDFALLLERQERDKDQIRQMSQGLNGAGH